MMYLGGKSRIAKPIARAILEANRQGEIKRYVEPFVGAANILGLVAPRLPKPHAGDLHEDLILLLKAVRSGWKPPSRVSEAMYEGLRDAEPSALRGFVGFACSFSGKWFGGYARDPLGGRDYASGAARGLVALAPTLRRVDLRCIAYQDWDVGPGDLVYADPPYAGRAGYSVGVFDSTRFWATMDDWSERGAFVLVSEYKAPDNWTPIWQRSVSSTVAADKAGTDMARTERLWAPL